MGLELRCSRLLQCRARKERREREGLAARSFETVPLPLAAPTLSCVFIINRHPCVMSTTREGLLRQKCKNILKQYRKALPKNLASNGFSVLCLVVSF